MTKTELMENCTAEQLADMVEKMEKYSEIKETAKKQVGERLKLIDFSKNPYSVICDLKDLIYEFAKGCDDEDMNNLEYYKRRISELEEECVKKQNEINQLEESCGRMKTRVDTWVNYIFPRATEEARKMIDNHQYVGIRIATCEEWANRGKDNQHEFESVCQNCKHGKKIEDLEHDLKTAGEKIQDLAGENMKLQCERNDYKSKSDFLEVERMRVKKNEITDFLPTEPIKVADMLINAEGEYEHNPVVKAISGNDKGAYRVFNSGELRQIAEHLLVYCNHNGEAEE